MRYEFDPTGFECSSCGGVVEKVTQIRGHYSSQWAADNIVKGTYDYETREILGYRCDICNLQYMILEGE